MTNRQSQEAGGEMESRCAFWYKTQKMWGRFWWKRKARPGKIPQGMGPGPQALCVGHMRRLGSGGCLCHHTCRGGAPEAVEQATPLLSPAQHVRSWEIRPYYGASECPGQAGGRHCCLCTIPCLYKRCGNLPHAAAGKSGGVNRHQLHYGNWYGGRATGHVSLKLSSTVSDYSHRGRKRRLWRIFVHS